MLLLVSWLVFGNCSCVVDWFIHTTEFIGCHLVKEHLLIVTHCCWVEGGLCMGHERLGFAFLYHEISCFLCYFSLSFHLLPRSSSVLIWEILFLLRELDHHIHIIQSCSWNFSNEIPILPGILNLWFFLNIMSEILIILSLRMFREEILLWEGFKSWWLVGRG